MNKIVMLIGVFALLSHSSCTSSKGEIHNEKESKFLVTSPIKMDTALTENFVSQIRSIRHIELRAQERGYLQKIFVDEGQLVKKGQLMFQIMPQLYEAEQQKAAAQLSFAKIEYENTKTLADSNIVAPNELALAKAEYDKAKAELSLAQVHLGFTEIRAPFDGIMNRLNVREGSLIDEGELLTELSDNSKMWVYFNVPESKYLDYQSNTNKNEKQEVRLLMANNKVFEYPGIIETIEADFNHETGNIAYRATFPNSKGLLRHGQTGNVLLNVPLNNALLIPQKATFEVMDKRYVFVIDKDDVVRSRAINVAAEMPHIYAIQNGLDEDDKILLEGLRLVRENDKIAHEFIAPQVALSDLDLYAE